MSMELQVVDRNGAIVLDERLDRIREEAVHLIHTAKADNTSRAYASDWTAFCAWCDDHGLQVLPASVETIALYLTDQKDTLKVSTLQRRMSSINQAHRMARYEPFSTRGEPLHSLLQSIRKQKGTAQEGKAPVLVDDIRAMAGIFSDSLIGVRDRAMLLVGFTGAFRRSELVSLDTEDLEFTREGLVINLRKSKTDQEGQGRKVGIPYGSNLETCPVRSLQQWIEVGRIKQGSLFRAINRHGQIQRGRLSDKSVALIVKRYVQAAGLDPAKYGGHSLRSGLATSAAIAGVSERSIMAQTGHKSVNMVRRYIRDGSLFRNNAAASLGL